MEASGCPTGMLSTENIYHMVSFDTVAFSTDAKKLVTLRTQPTHSGKNERKTTACIEKSTFEAFVGVCFRFGTSCIIIYYHKLLFWIWTPAGREQEAA